MGLLSLLIGDMAEVGWPGQFDLDFLCMLGLSGTWVAWRHHFSPAGLGLALLAAFGGSLFLSLYLLIESIRLEGNTKALLLGPDRAAR
ncbi:hypothetical protein [Synechococcus sp. CS-1328]|uniref:hypothetical protein n=1 Tax=Synechococcus sp. CS-1328 TaxID=2847976 RepID=UPI00223B1727|nr:hypothetical protein [Synechococcus sp. CS-1328]